MRDDRGAPFGAAPPAPGAPAAAAAAAAHQGAREFFEDEEAALASLRAGEAAQGAAAQRA